MSLLAGSGNRPPMCEISCKMQRGNSSTTVQPTRKQQYRKATHKETTVPHQNLRGNNSTAGQPTRKQQYRIIIREETTVPQCSPRGNNSTAGQPTRKQQYRIKTREETTVPQDNPRGNNSTAETPHSPPHVSEVHIQQTHNTRPYTQ